jgi:hypothetical protein
MFANNPRARRVVRCEHIRIIILARFFLHLHNCGTLIPDDEGRDFPNLEAAVERAKYEARELLAAEVTQGKLCLGCQIEVVEESTGRSIVVPFSATVHLESVIVEKPELGSSNTAVPFTPSEATEQAAWHPRRSPPA